MENYENDLAQCLFVLQRGGVVLFPTDTIWGLGCDATNSQAVGKILQLKQRQAAQGLIVLLAEETDIPLYARPVDASLLAGHIRSGKPTTIIYEDGRGVADNILPENRTLAIRVVKDAFCQELIRQFGKPIVSTSANLHGQPAPQNFSEVAPEIVAAVDYTTVYRREEQHLFQPSTILKIGPDGAVETIRP